MFDMEYFIHLIILINIYIILTTCTNLLVGQLNLLSLGQAAFYGLGAYLSAFALMSLHFPMLLTILFTMVGTGMLSLIIALPSLRLKGDYFVLATLGFQLLVFSILYNWVPVTKGPYGIPGIPAPSILNLIQISGNYAFLILSTILMLLIIFVFRRLINSPFGRILKGIRDDELSVKSLGKNVTLYKTQAFIISSSFISVAGFLYATYVSYIDPTSFNLDEAIFILSALIIGGTGNIKGPVIGGIVIILLPELLRFIGLPDAVAANMRQIIYGLSLILLMRFRSQGIAGNYVIK